jgi:hypothetical protein
MAFGIAPDGHVIVVEVKTTDAYRINLDTIAGYREQLIARSEVPRESSVLLVVGREDTGDLEAQVRGSRHAWTFRIISVDALMKLVSLKENAELASVAKIHELLVPFEYTRLDEIIDIAFTVVEDASAAAVESEQLEVPPSSLNESAEAASRTQQHTPSEVIAMARAQIVATLSDAYAPLVKRSRALYWSSDKLTRAAITISKQYKDGDYWYAYHPDWDTFLSEGTNSLFVLGCVGRDEAFVIPLNWIRSRLNLFYITKRDDRMYWHISLWPTNKGNMALHVKDGGVESVEQFKLALTKAQRAAR